MARFEKWSDDLEDALAAPFPEEDVEKADRFFFAPVHKYVDRLNNLVGHGWSMEPITTINVAGRLQMEVAITILGVTRRNFGGELERSEQNDSGQDTMYGSPETNAFANAFKRTASMFGMGREFHSQGAGGGGSGSSSSGGRTSGGGSKNEKLPCPECGGAMWDNRDSKTNERAPDFRCADKDCKPEGDTFTTGVWYDALVDEVKGLAEASGMSADDVEQTVKASKADPEKAFRAKAQLLKSQPEGEGETAGVGAGSSSPPEDDLPF